MFLFPSFIFIFKYFLDGSQVFHNDYIYSKLLVKPVKTWSWFILNNFHNYSCKEMQINLYHQQFEETFVFIKHSHFVMVFVPWPLCWVCSRHLFYSWRGPFVCPLGCGGLGISGTICTREPLVLGWLSSLLTPGPPRSTTSPWKQEDSGKWPWCWEQ